MGLFPDKSIVPVLMFHSVGLENTPWIFSHISEPVDLFHNKIKLIQKYGFHGIFWNVLYDGMTRNKKLPLNSIMLTFDDGYLDNWVYVFPYLKKYGLKATIFVNPDFVDPGANKRLNLEDVWQNRCTPEALNPAGFLNWQEMREMEESGLVDIQSHALTHTWYFSGPDIVDFHRPGHPSPYPWLFWNERPMRKPYYLTENQESFLPYGHPVFQYQKALIVKRYYPDDRFVARLIEFVENNGSEAFFSRNGWKKIISKYALSIKKSNRYQGTYETDDEHRHRVKNELYNSKNIIERNLNKKVEFICWPGGGNNIEVQKMAREVGYKSWTLPSKELSSFKNVPGANPEHIKRIGTGSTISIKGHGAGTGGAFHQVLRINEHRNSFFYKQINRLYKALYIFNTKH